MNADERENMNEENAKQIDELQGRVRHLEGQVTFLTGALSSAQSVLIDVQNRELRRIDERIEALKADVKP